MSTDEPVVRVLVVEPQQADQRDPATLRALQRLGKGARIEVVHERDALRRLLAGAVHDCAVVDERVGAEALPLLAEAAHAGVPGVFLIRTGGDAAAVEAFDQGARDCVRAGPDFESILPVAVLDQIRRVRSERARNEADARIQWLENLSRTVVEAIPTALAVLDAVGNVLRANPAFSRLCGRSVEASAGRPLRELLPDSLWSVAEAVWREAARGNGAGPRFAKGDAAGRAFDLRAAPLSEGRSLLLVSEVTEVEDLLRQVGHLRRTNEDLIQNMNGAVLMLDSTGHVRFANPGALELLGDASPEGRDARAWIQGDTGRDLLVAVLERGERIRGVEIVVRRPDGASAPVAVAAAPLHDEGGSPRGAVAILQDLSELKQLQRQVLQTEKMASIGQLAAGVAHEINNPMGFVHANLYQVSEYVDDLTRVWDQVRGLRRAIGDAPATPELRRAAELFDATVEEVEADFLVDDLGKAVRESLEGSERVRHIVQDLRAFSHQDTAERTLADINKALDSTANIVWTMMKHSVKLTKDYGDLPPVSCYPMQLKQVWMNLLVNATQAVEQRMGAEGIRGEIRLHTRAEGGSVVVEVTDNGSGIPPEVRERIFEPFFTTKEVGEGTGLGLATTYTLVRRHGGELSVASPEGEGATFRVRLPVEPPQGGSPETP
ncbi:MAG: ATP-binding protein [Myxococcota bacterium]|nr:ATP-binding protein [Myxococcota bacterium]